MHDVRMPKSRSSCLLHISNTLALRSRPLAQPRLVLGAQPLLLRQPLFLDLVLLAELVPADGRAAAHAERGDGDVEIPHRP